MLLVSGVGQFLPWLFSLHVKWINPLHYIIGLSKKPLFDQKFGQQKFARMDARLHLYSFFCIFIQFRIPNLPPTGLSFFAQSNEIIKNHTNAQDTVLSKQLHTNNCFRSLILIATCSNKGFAVFVTALSLKCGNFFILKKA